jgi:hypothetical protein
MGDSDSKFKMCKSAKRRVRRALKRHAINEWANQTQNLLHDFYGHGCGVLEIHVYKNPTFVSIEMEMVDDSIIIHRRCDSMIVWVSLNTLDWSKFYITNFDPLKEATALKNTVNMALSFNNRSKMIENSNGCVQ